MATIASLNVKIGADVKNLQRDLNKAKRQIRQQGKEMQQLGNQLSMSVTLPIVAFLGRSAQLWDKQANAIAQVEAGLKSTGNTAGFSSKQLQDMASNLQNLTTFGDEDILKDVTANLLTFTKVAGPVFDKAQMAILNLSTRLGVDLKSASIQVGKALNDPIAGLTALRRSGIQFTTSQQDMIKSLVKSGEVVKAQEIILAELETQFGGSAEAAAKAGAGPIKQFQNSMGDAMELVGKSVMPTLIQLAQSLNNALQWFSSLSDETRNTALKFALFAAAVGPAIKIIGFGMVAWSRTVLIFQTLGKSVAIVTGVMKLQTAQVAAGEIAASKMGMAVAEMRKAWMAFDTATKATTIGLIAVAIGAAVLAFNHFTSELSAAGKAQRTLKDVNAEAAKSIVAERLVAERLTAVLKNETASREQKEAALKRLKEINKSYFGDLDTEKSKITDIDTALQNYIGSIEKRAKLAAANDKLIELEKRMIDLNLEGTKSGKELAGILGNLPGISLTVATSRVKDLQKERKEIENTKKALLDFISVNETRVKSTKSPVTPTAGTGNAPKQVRQKLLATTDLLPSTMEMETAVGILADVIGGNIEKAVPQVEVAGDRMKNALTLLGESFDIIDNKAAVFGAAFDPIDEKIKSTEAAITSLLESGVSPFSNDITFLIEKLKALKGSLDENKQKWTEFGEGVQEAVKVAFSESLVAFADGLGSLFAGISSGKNLLAAMLMPMLDMLTNIGKMAIATGVAVLGIKKALQSLNPVAAIAGGIALIALSKFVKSKLANSVPKFAEGGFVTAPTLAMVGDNRSGTEAIIPLEKMGDFFNTGNSNIHLTGDVRWSGREFVIAFEQANKSMDRIRGPK